MAEFPVRAVRARCPSHPGVLMHETLSDHLCLSVADAARRMGVSRQALHNVLAGRTSATATMALRFSALAGGTPELLLRMRHAHDSWQARAALGPALGAIEPARAA